MAAERSAWPPAKRHEADASVRLFLALWPDAAAREAIVAWRSSSAWPEAARTTRPEALHLTLHFIGDVPRARLPELALGLRVPVDPFDLVLDEAQVWHGGIAVLEPARAPRELLDLQARLGEALRALELRVEERPYRPHLTLARQAQGARMAALPPARFAWRVWSYALVESAGGRYATIAAFGDRARC